MNGGYEIKWSYDLRSYESNFCNCVEKPENFRTSTGFRCDALTNWAMKPLTLGRAGHLWLRLRSWNFQDSLRNCKNCSHNCEDHSFIGVQGWRGGEGTRLPPMWPGFDSQTRRHMWVEFAGSLICTERFFPGTPVSPLLKNRHLTWFTFIVHFSLQCPQLALQR